MTPFSILRGVHIAVGFTALASFWVPLFAPKGGRLHRNAGWVFAIAMFLAAGFAWVLCGLRLVDDNTANDRNAIFLAFVGLLSANGASTGLRVLKTKSRTGQHRDLFDVGSSALLLASSVGLAIYGLPLKAMLLVSFSCLGLFLAVGQLRFWLKAPESKKAWWFRHMSSMLAACIATVTAFAVVNISRLGLDQYALLVWLAPGVVGGIGIAAWGRYYRLKFEAPSQGA